MTNKITSIFVCIAVIFTPLSIITAPSIRAADIPYELSVNQQATLKAVGVYQDDIKLHATLTRADFAKMLYTMLFANREKLKIDFNVFSDVSENDDSYESISALAAMRIIPITQDVFMPEQKITVMDAANMVIDAILYVSSCVDINENDISYIREKILKNTFANDGSSLSVYSGLMLIYNMLYFDNSALYDYNVNEDTLIENYLNMYKVVGVVTDDASVCKYGLSKLKAGNIKIDDEDFVNQTGYTDLFGKSVYGFYTKNDDKKQLLSIIITNDNSSLYIHTDNIKSFDINTRTYTYYPDEIGISASEKFKLPNDILVVYNGKCLEVYDDFTDNMFLPSNGYVELIDNDGDNEYDIIFIYSYNTYVVKLCDVQNQVIYFKDKENPLELHDKRYSIVTDKFSISSLESLSENAVVSVACSLNDKVIKIFQSTQLSNDIVESIESENNNIKYIFTETGAKYKLNNEFIESKPLIELSKEYTFYFDYFGNVADIEKKPESEWKVGILYKCATSSDEHNIAIINSENVKEIFNFSKKVNIYNMDDSEVRLKAENAVIYLENKNYIDIIRYKINIYGQVSMIEFPLQRGLVPTREDRLCKIAETSTDSSNIYYYKNLVYKVSGTTYFNFASLAVADNSTLIMSLPEDRTDEENYEILSFTKLPTSTGKFEFCAYSTDYQSKLAKVVIINNSKRLTNQIIAISNVYREYFPESCEIAGVVEGIVEGNQVKYKVRDMFLIENVKTLINANVTKELSNGDVALLYEKNGYIDDIRLIYDADGELNGSIGVLAGVTNDNFDFTYNIKTGNPYSLTENFETSPSYIGAYRYTVGFCRVCLSYVYSLSKDKNFITITTQNLKKDAYKSPILAEQEGYLDYVYPYQNKGATIIISRNVTAKLISQSDFKPYTTYGIDCSKCLIVYIDGKTFMIVINDEYGGK